MRWYEYVSAEGLQWLADYLWNVRIRECLEAKKNKTAARLHLTRNMVIRAKMANRDLITDQKTKFAKVYELIV